MAKGIVILRPSQSEPRRLRPVGRVGFNERGICPPDAPNSARFGLAMRTANERSGITVPEDKSQGKELLGDSLMTEVR